jgi:hypothetical protein
MGVFLWWRAGGRFYAWVLVWRAVLGGLWCGGGKSYAISAGRSMVLFLVILNLINALFRALHLICFV